MSDTTRSPVARKLRIAIVSFVLAQFGLVGSVVAQSNNSSITGQQVGNALCNIGFLSAGSTAVIWLALMISALGFFLTFVGSKAAEAVPFMSKDMIKSLKSDHRTALHALSVLFIGMILWDLIITNTNTPWPPCIDPFPLT
ncbi:MAG: hypothetical protein ABEI86_06615 [Halobacteriaceae archaeon]